MKETNKPRLKRALLIMLRPLVRLLIKQDVSHSEFAEIAKEAYVRTAFEDMPLPGKKPTVSRAAVITGLSRKDVARILGTAQAQALPKLTPNRAARVTTGWLSDPDFCTSAGKAKPLNKAAFDALTQRYSGDITPGAIYDELARLQLIETDAEGDIHLKPGGFVVGDSAQTEGFALLAKSLTHLLETGEYNLTTGDDGNTAAHFQRQLTERQVPTDIAEAFHQRASEKSMQLLIELNQWLDAQLKANTSTPRNNNDHQNHIKDTKDFVGLGIYYFESRNQERSHEKPSTPQD